MEEKKIAYRYGKISCEQFSTNHLSLPTNDSKDISLDSSITFGASLPHNIIVSIRLTFFRNNDKTSPFLILEVSQVFDIKEDDFISLQDENKNIVIPAKYVRMLTNYVFAVSRGILYAKTEGTVFNEYQIPPISLKDESEIVLSAAFENK